MSSAADLRLPPQATQEERCLIGSLMLMPSAIDEVNVTADDYYKVQHQVIHHAIWSLWTRGVKGIDAVTVANELERTGELSNSGGAVYLAELLETVPHAAHAVYYARIVKEASKRRAVIKACHDAMTAAYGGTIETEEIIRDLDSAVLQMQDLTSEQHFITLDEAMHKAEVAQHTPAVVHPTGILTLDERLSRGGFSSPQLVVVAARPGGGKSVISGQIALNRAKRGSPALFISLEMEDTELAERFINSRLYESADMRGIPLFFNETAQSIDRIRRIVRLGRRKHGIEIVFVDYLQLVEPSDTRKSRDLQIGEISRGLKLLAKELKITIVAACQLSRNSEKENRKPRLVDLRESGSIEQDADVVLLLHHEEAQSEIIIAKQRRGDTTVVPVRFDRKRTVFRSVEFGEDLFQL